MIILLIVSLTSSIVLLCFLGAHWLTEMVRRQRDYSMALRCAEKCATTIEALESKLRDAQSSEQAAPESADSNRAFVGASAPGTRSRAAEGTATEPKTVLRRAERILDLDNERAQLAKAHKERWSALGLFHVSDYVSDRRLRAFINNLLSEGFGSNTAELLDGEH